MLLLLIAIITLAFMINYFLKINFVTDNKIDDNKDTTTNDSISYSVTIANFEENKDAFLNFALFFLMYKRPFGYKDGIETQSNTRGTISGGNDRGIEGAGSSKGCNTICSNDQSCNAWQYSSGQCKKYNVSDPSHINITDLSGNSGEGDNIGYLFRPSDTSWAVSDLSGLSSNHDVFKSVADVVLLSDSTNEELLERASIISASSNVKYCYEQEITQGGISQEYTTLRDDALKKLEDSCKFFIFSGDSGDFPHKTEYSLYFSLIVDVIHKDLFKTDSHLKNEILKAVDELKVYMAEYKLTKDFFNSELDKDMNSTIDREELTMLYREKILNGNTWDAQVIGENFSIGADTCINESGITELVESFFSKYDLNQNGLVTLEEILSSLSIPRPKYSEFTCPPPTSCPTTTCSTTRVAAAASVVNTTTPTTTTPTTTTTTTTTTTEPPEDTWGGDKWPYKCYGCDKDEDSAPSDCEDVPSDRCKDGRFIVSKNNTLLPTPKKYGRDGDGNYIKFPRNDVTLCGWKDNKCQDVDSDFAGWEGG